MPRGLYLPARSPVKPATALSQPVGASPRSLGRRLRGIIAYSSHANADKGVGIQNSQLNDLAAQVRQRLESALRALLP
jgi:hypothetical protein